MNHFLYSIQPIKTCNKDVFEYSLSSFFIFSRQKTKQQYQPNQMLFIEIKYLLFLYFCSYTFFGSPKSDKIKDIWEKLSVKQYRERRKITSSIVTWVFIAVGRLRALTGLEPLTFRFFCFFLPLFTTPSVHDTVDILDSVSRSELKRWLSEIVIIILLMMMMTIFMKIIRIMISMLIVK